MKIIRNILVVSIAVFGLGIGSAQAGLLGLDTNGPLDLSFGEFDPFQAPFGGDAGCVDEFTCNFDAFYSLGPQSWVLTDDAGNQTMPSFVDQLDLLVQTSGGSVFGYLELLLDDGSFLQINFTEFGSLGTGGPFEFIGNIFGGYGNVYDQFIAIGTDVGLLMAGQGESYSANLVALPVSVPEPGTLFLLGAGLAGLGISRRRGKV